MTEDSDSLKPKGSHKTEKCIRVMAIIFGVCQRLPEEDKKYQD